MILILIPVRMLFYSYVSTDWLGSFGAVSLISILLLILVKKNKLGRFGVMFQNQLSRLQRGKTGTLVYTYSLFTIFVLTMMIVAIEQGNSTYVDLKESIILQAFEQYQSGNYVEPPPINISTWMRGSADFFMLMLTNSPDLSARLAIVNDLFDGWLLHFYTVGLVETVEVFGILVFYRFTFHNKQKPE